MKSLSTVLALSALVAVSSAQSYITSGALTASDPKFVRPVSSTALSSYGTNNAYDTYAFSVSVTGAYSAELASPSSTLDTYLLVYSTFTPSNSLTGLINGDDDFPGTLSILGIPNPATNGFRASKIVTGDATNLKTGGLLLTAGVTYTAVVTAYDPVTLPATGLGSYTLGIGGGPGAVSPVPEPATMAVLGLGLAAMVRRRKKA